MTTTATLATPPLKGGKNKTAQKGSFSAPPPPVLTERLDHHFQVLRPWIQHWRDTQNIPHALLFTGPPGIGKLELARFLAQWFQCEHTLEDPAQEGFLLGGLSTPAPASQEMPCGECSSCRKITQGQSLDLQIISPTQEFSKSSSVKIDQLRSIRENLGFGPHESRFRIYILHEAEAMTAAAVNSFLKVLEEPPSRWIFILTSSDASLLLPTLVSRCLRVRLQPLPQSLLKALLLKDEIPATRAEKLASLSQGSWDRSHQLTQEETWKFYEDLCRFFKEPAFDFTRLIDWATQSSSQTELFLDLLESQVHEALFAHPGSRSQFYLLDLASRIQEVRKHLGAPLNRKMQLQSLLLPLLGGAPPT